MVEVYYRFRRWKDILKNFIQNLKSDLNYPIKGINETMIQLFMAEVVR